MRAVLFVGPSLDPGVAAAVFPGEVLPPIKRGDIDALIAQSRPPDIIGIVDGAFLQTMAISPKEVLRALDRRIRVYGSSSMGALRAVECMPFGMIGIGRVFELYASGEIDADDEVAITFDGDTGRALCEPMVNLRISLRAAAEAGIVSEATAERVTSIAQASHFPARSHARLLHAAREEINAVDHAALVAWFAGSDAPNQKRADALELIAAVTAVLDDAVAVATGSPA